LLPLSVCQQGTSLCVLIAVAIPLLVPVRVCQLGTGLCVLLTVAVPLLLLGYGGHAAPVDSLFLEVAFIAIATL
jgi:hypothetical protein